MRSRLAALPLLLVLALAGCVAPQGAPIEVCGPDWQPAVVEGPGTLTGPARTIPIECYRVVAERRIEVGFAMPPGPDCYAVGFVEVVEDADAVSLELRIGEARNPLGGACPEEAFAWGTPVELNRAIEGRAVLDASRPGG